MNNRKQYHKEYYNKNKHKPMSKHRKDYLINYRLNYKFNITIDKYNKILSDQNNCCNICKKHKDEFKNNLHVDHCHNTGKIRGILCFECNILLGKAKDNINTLNNAIDYLNNNNSKDN
jgi:hypothetical protein